LKITYTSTNIAWHFRYALELHRLGQLHAFVTGASRFSPRGAGHEFGSKLVRRDVAQNLYLASLKARLPAGVSHALNRWSNAAIDCAAYQYAKESEVFLFYRTTGVATTRRLHREKSKTFCVMEEVNSHVDCCHELMKQEYEKLGIGSYADRFADHGARLLAYEEADAIVCPSSFVKRSFLERGFPEHKLLTVNFGFTFPETAAADPEQRDGDVFRLLYVGQINFRKGLRYALDAFGKLKHPKKEFLVVGPTTAITGLENITIPEGVRFAGILKGPELEAAYASATAFVLPTVEEGLALVQGEAMAAGLPLITTTRSGGDDIMQDGVEGFIVPPADAGALLEAFQKLADSPELSQRMGEAAMARAKQLGGWDVAARDLVDALSGAREQAFKSTCYN
jgi:glycosyltransferase involved in cell wall biosynthesis